MKARSILFILILIIVSVSATAQYYDTGQDPANIKWFQIKTNNFRIIYPESYKSNGQKYAEELERATLELKTIFPVKKFRIPVIIHNYTTQSNGYVAWAPKRMELYPTPEQNTIPLDAARQLALHELTHVMQMEYINKGFSRLMALFLGQQYTGISASLLPQWYLEGDAVFSESVFTASGRGRSASFQKQLKAISVEKGHMYKYDKLVNGSFRNFIPDHYQTGFQAVAFANLKYDPGVWTNVLKTTGNFPFLIDPVNVSLLHNTGNTKKQLFRETFDTLNKIWQQEINSNGSLPYVALNPVKKRGFVSYYSPVALTGNKIAAIRTSLQDPPSFVLIDPLTNEEQKIYVPGLIYPYSFSGAISTLVWVETQTDPRWNNRNYSVIKIMDIRDRTVKQLTWKTRYMSASVSPDGKTIATIENSVYNKNTLVFIDSKTGRVINSVPVPGNSYLQRLQWSADGRSITGVSLNEKGEGIILYRQAERTWRILLEEGNEDYQSTSFRNDSLFYVSSSSGTENIFVRTPDGSVKKLTNSQFGATDLSLDGGKIYFSDYSSSGNNVCSLNIKNIPAIKYSDHKSSFSINGIEKPQPVAEFKPDQNYSPTRYRKWKHLLNFHSWMPFYADLEEVKTDPRSIKPGFTIMSQNHLSSLTTSLGYEYSDNLHKFHSNLVWKGWYPVLESRIDYGYQNSIYKNSSSVNDPQLIKPGLNFKNSISIPLIFSTGKYYQYFYPTVTATYQNGYIYRDDEAGYDYGQTELSARFYFANFYRSTMLDIYPRFAQSFDFNFSFYPFDSDIYGPYTTFRSAFYFPGFIKNNGIRFRYENDEQTIQEITLMNRIKWPRGYKSYASEDLSLLTVDYVLPLFYPDFNFLSLIYIKRIRTGLFYDFAKGTGNYHPTLQNGSIEYQYNSGTESFSSMGLELISDFHVLRLPYMISAGVQAAWKKGMKTPVFEMILNIDIFGMNIGKSQL